MVSWSGPARMLRDRIATVEQEEYVRAAQALGGNSLHVFARHVWPAIRVYAIAIFLSRIPVAILAESTVSFLGISKVEPMSLGRYLGASFGNLLYPAGIRTVGPAWLLLVAIVFVASSTSSRALSGIKFVDSE